jgi:Kef-type K+ transport system membrane component KefB|tara:strand:- start:1359 stop:2813 length:1455 start_codon:yes stop_codon:yes gene_type:complete
MDFLPTLPLATNTLFFFGFLLFCGALGGYLAHRVSWIPSITGFMLVGLVAGPNGLQLFGYETLANAKIVIDISLALILYRLGLSLDWRAIVKDKALLAVSMVEATLTFAAVYVALVWFGIPTLPAAVIGAIAISSSPAVLIHVAHELGAHGPTTARSEALVALNNVIAFLVFAALLPALYNQSNAPLATMIGSPAYQLLGSSCLGLVMGLALHHVARTTKGASQYSLALVVGAVAMTLGLAMMFKLSVLFAPLVLGLVVRGVERKNVLANMDFGPAFELFFVALFVYAGASLHLKEMLAFAPAAAVFVVARSVAKWVGVAATGTLMGWPRKANLNAGLILLPMAGMAIGLANTTAEQFPYSGAVVASVVFAAVAVFETIGPPVVARALRWAGDVPSDYEGRGMTVADTQFESSDDASNNTGQDPEWHSDLYADDASNYSASDLSNGPVGKATNDTPHTGLSDTPDNTGHDQAAHDNNEHKPTAS